MRKEDCGRKRRKIRMIKGRGLKGEDRNSDDMSSSAKYGVSLLWV